MDRDIEVQQEGYHLVGKIGCELSERAHIGLSQVIAKNPKLKYHSEFLHETPYETQINLTKTKHDNFQLRLRPSTESPFVFHNGQYLGGWSELSDQICQNYGIEATNSMREQAAAETEKRKFEAFNMTAESFVSMTIMVDHPDLKESNPQKHQVIVQLFDKYCPKTCKRFKDLCEGINMDGVLATYKHNNCSRVSKDSFVQFGNLLLTSAAEIEPLEDESYQLKNDCPGMIGMVSGNERHSNTTQFYITTNPMSYFNGKQVVFGRVISGFDCIRLLNQLQNPDDLKPSMNACIIDIQVQTKELPPDVIEKQRIEAAKLPPTAERIELVGPKGMKEFFADFDMSKHSIGPKELVLRGIKGDEFFNLLKINLTQLETIHFSSCRFDGKWMPKMIVRGKFFNSVKNWTFRHCKMDKNILKSIFVNKSVQKPETLKIINRADGNSVFSAL